LTAESLHIVSARHESQSKLFDGIARQVAQQVDVAPKTFGHQEGCSDGKPTVKLTNNQAAGSMFALSTAHSQLMNIWIEEQAQACSAAAIAISAAGVHLEDLYLEGDDNSDAALCTINASGTRASLRGCSFVSTEATTSNAPPTIGLELSAAVDCVRLDSVIFDGGTLGFSDYALKASAAAMTSFRALNVSFLRGADYSLHASSTGYLNPQTVTGQHMGVW